MELRFESDGDFETDAHQTLRETAWMGGPYAELKYLLSCIERIDYWNSPFETWNTALRKFIAQQNPSATWILRARHFDTFAVLLMRAAYRESVLGQRFPIAPETRKHAAARFAIDHPELHVDVMAANLRTTAKQLQRNSDLQLAIIDYRLLNPEP
jgi:hypothetical protein